MQLDATTIERIVGDVLRQLGASTAAMRTSRTPAAPDPPFSGEPQATASNDRAEFDHPVITGELLEARLNGLRTIAVSSHSVLTPTARDVIRERDVTVVRRSPADQTANRAANMRFLVVNSTPGVEQSLRDGGAARVLAGCVEEAANSVISIICRGEAADAVIVTDKPHRAACLANRNERIRAAVANDAADVRSIGGELGVNVWCVNPAGRSAYELTRIWKTIHQSGARVKTRG